MKLSEKALGIKPSSTLSITEKAGILRSEGKNVISFSIGEPDFDTPEHIKKAAVDAINAGFTRYTAAAGIVELRKAVAKKLKEDNGLDYDYTQIVRSKTFFDKCPYGNYKSGRRSYYSCALLVKLCGNGETGRWNTSSCIYGSKRRICFDKKGA